MFQCTRCKKEYLHKSGLSAHIKTKHPLETLAQHNEKKKHAKKPVEPEPAKTPAKNLWKISNLDTKEVDNLLADEEEFYDAIDEMEHGIGINKSMIDWANINFSSSFGDSGELKGGCQYSSYSSVANVKQTPRLSINRWNYYPRMINSFKLAKIS